MNKTYFFDLDGTLLGMDQDKFLQVYFSSIKDYITSLGHDYKVFFYYLDLGIKAMLNNKGKNTVQRKGFLPWAERVKKHETSFSN